MERRPIQKLSALVAERIAAGEVVERPASALKELVANALDANATAIEIYALEGGKQELRITDNGFGMPEEDLNLAVERHATSKLQSVEDLETLMTLGFRGEALPSLGAVSHLEITSRTDNAPHAYRKKISGGENRPAEATAPRSFLGSAHGTEVKVLDVFSQIPARLKFLKSASAEFSAIRDWVEKFALARPDVRFDLIHDQKKVLQLPIGTLPDRMRELLLDGGKESAIRSAQFEMEGFSAELHWLEGASFSNTRSIIQIVNGRVLRDKVLSQALMQGFRQHFLPGQFPGLVLKIEMDPMEIDVNVHPTKTEVRFLDSSAIFRAIHKLIHQCLEERLFGFIRPASGLPDVPAPSTPKATQEPLPWGNTAGGFSKIFETKAKVSESPISMPAYSPGTDTELPQRAEADKSNIQEIPPPVDLGRFVGIFWNTYIVFEKGPELLWIDQHAAHERVRFEKLKTSVFRDHKIPKQELMFPEAVKLKAESLSEITPFLERLQTLGFEAEAFGRETLMFRAVPSAWGKNQLGLRLRNFIENLLSEEQQLLQDDPRWDQVLFERLASEACHSAIRAGDALHAEDVRALVDQLFACETPWNCPHGRPTTYRVSEGKVEEWFQRRV